MKRREQHKVKSRRKNTKVDAIPEGPVTDLAIFEDLEHLMTSSDVPDELECLNPSNIMTKPVEIWIKFECPSIKGSKCALSTSYPLRLVGTFLWMWVVDIVTDGMHVCSHSAVP